MEKDLRDVLTAEKSEEVVTTGIMCDLTEGITKQGNPYVSFKLYANGYSFPVKIWDITVKGFLEKYKISYGSPIKVHGIVSINPLSGEKQLCLRDGAVPAVTPLQLSDEELERMVQSTPVDVKEMLKDIYMLINMYLPGDNERYKTIRSIALWSYFYLENCYYYPYSMEIHKERGGLISHIYNVCYKLIYYIGGPKFDKGIVLAAVLSYHLGVILYYDVDYVTGMIRKSRELYEALGLEDLCLDFILNWNADISLMVGMGDNMIRDYIACIKCLNSKSLPISIEATVAKNLVEGELSIYQIYEATYGLEPLDKAFIRKDDEVRAVYRFI